MNFSYSEMKIDYTYILYIVVSKHILADTENAVKSLISVFQHSYTNVRVFNIINEEKKKYKYVDGLNIILLSTDDSDCNILTSKRLSMMAFPIMQKGDFVRRMLSIIKTDVRSLLKERIVTFVNPDERDDVIAQLYDTDLQLVKSTPIPEAYKNLIKFLNIYKLSSTVLFHAYLTLKENNIIIICDQTQQNLILLMLKYNIFNIPALNTIYELNEYFLQKHNKGVSLYHANCVSKNIGLSFISIDNVIYIDCDCNYIHHALYIKKITSQSLIPVNKAMWEQYKSILSLF